MILSSRFIQFILASCAILLSTAVFAQETLETGSPSEEESLAAYQGCAARYGAIAYIADQSSSAFADYGERYAGLIRGLSGLMNEGDLNIIDQRLRPFIQQQIVRIRNSDGSRNEAVIAEIYSEIVACDGLYGLPTSPYPPEFRQFG